MSPINLPRPAWMTEDLVLLEEQARRFMQAEFTPHVDRWHAQGMYEREVWTKAGEARPVVRRDAGGLRLRGRQLRAPGGHQPRDQSLWLRRLRRAASFRHRRPLHSSLR